jgi:glycosyltransferase involved in cell wall biosynthesis
VTRRRVFVVASEVLGVAGTGGPGVADSLLAAALARNGHEVELLVAPGREIQALGPDWERIYGDAGVRVRPLAARPEVRPRFLAPTVAVYEALRDAAPDVVVADDWRGLAYASLRARQLGVALRETAFVVYCHGPARVLAESARKVPDTVARFGEEIAERASIELADAVVSPSAWLLAWMREHGWPVPDSARVVQNLRYSTALGVTPVEAPRAPIRRLAFFGQLREGKGLRLFVEALRQLEPELLGGVELLFLGRETPRWTPDRIRAALGDDVAALAASIRIETGLERRPALAELVHPGTLAVMPSLLENSPYAVVECIEHRIPFVAAEVGGVPELVAPEDRARVLCAPSADDLASALRRALSGSSDFIAGPARATEESLDEWLRLIESAAPPETGAAPAANAVAVVARPGAAAERARRLADNTRTVAVDVVEAGSRAEALDRVSADWVVFLDEDDEPDDALLDALVAAQAASGADVVTAAVRPAGEPGAIHVFLGDPRALGLVENQYGVLGLVRRSVLADRPPPEGGGDPDWPLFAGLALAGARVVSIPEPLSGHRGRPGRVSDVPGEGLEVLETFERDGFDVVRELPQLAATLAAAGAKLEVRSAVAPSKRGLAGVLRRARRRFA